MFDFYKENNIPCFGVAGNFTGHLEQAGEAVDFAKMKVSDKNAPKAIFPTFIPKSINSITPEFLTVFPFSDSKIIFPKETNSTDDKLQIESECAIIFKAVWKEDPYNSFRKILSDLQPVGFGASNDCSIRKAGAKKISLKKNWGNFSKGLSSNIISLNKFEKGCILDDYRIASYLIRDDKIFVYGENSEIKTYSYIYEKLTGWLIDKFNNQQDDGPAENIYEYLKDSGFPEKIMISIGATRYTDFGENNFLQNGDISCVILYPQSKYSEKEIEEKLKNKIFPDDISALIQNVVMPS